VSERVEFNVPLDTSIGQFRNESCQPITWLWSDKANLQHPR